MMEMKGKVCIVTGSNSGIGKETVLALAKMNTTVIMVVRNSERGEKAKTEIINKSGNRSINVMICDVSSLDSMRHFAKEFREKYDRLDVLINNAGAVFNKREVTVEGFERTFAVNYLGPFVLTHELMSLLKSSAPSRVINFSSGLYKSGKINLDNLQSEKAFNGMKTYANAKLMVIMFTYELARRLQSTGVTLNVVLPGFVATNLGRNTGSILQSIMFKLVRPMQISAKKAAKTPVYLASSNEVTNLTGKCFEKMHETTTSSISHNLQVQKQLWNKTLELVGQSYD